MTPITSNAWVNAESLSDGNWVDTEVGSDGSYTITGVAAGNYRLRAYGIDLALEFYDEAGSSGDAAATVVVTAGADTPNIDFTLDPGGKISGRIYAGDGITPLPYVGVQVNSTWISTCTDGNGDYTLYNLPLDSPLLVNAGGDNWCGGALGYFDQWWQGAASQAAATPITLTLANRDITGIDFSLVLGGSISGHIYEFDGVTPITNNASVYAGALSGNGGYGTNVNSDGSYQIVGLAAGDYRVSAQGSDYAIEFYDQVGSSGDNANVITVMLGVTVPSIDFTLDPGGTISGTVYALDGVTPIVNRTVNAAGTWVSACTDSNGFYTLYNLPLNVPLKVNTVWDNWCGGGNDFVGEWWPDSLDENGASTVTLTDASPDQTGIDFALGPGGSVSGHLYESDGTTPITSNAWVNAEDPVTGVWFGGTGVRGDGSYTIVGLSVGNYRLRAYGDGRVIEYYNNAGTNGDSATIVMVAAGADTPNIDFTLDPAGTISGTIYEADGVTPVANMRVDAEGVWVGTCTDLNGHYTLYNQPLNVPLKVSTGSNNGCGGGLNYREEWWQNAASFNDATPIVLTSGAPNASGIDFTLELGGSVSGHVYESDGTTPITSNAWVNVEDPDTGVWLGGAGVNSDGSYTIYGIPAGDFRIRAQGDGYALEFYDEAGATGDSATLVAVSAGADTPNIDFTLDPGGTISGTVYEIDGLTPIANMRVDSDNAWVGTCTDANGHFTLYNAPLNVSLTVNSGGDNWCGSSQDYLQEWWQDAATQDAAAPVVLTSGAADVTGIDFALELGGEIAGTATAAEDGTPLADLWLCAFDYNAAAFNESPPWICTQTRSDGTYTLTAVPVGENRVWIFPEDRLRLFYSGSNAFAGATPVTVTAGNTTAGIDFSLPLAGIITGHVYDGNGNPIDGLTISLADGSYPECSQPDGSYRIFVPAGSHIIKAEVGMCNNGLDFSTRYYDGVTDESAATPVTVAVGETVSNIDFTLDQSANETTLVGSVTLQGRPASPDARWVLPLHIVVTPQGGGAAVFDGEVTTDESGQFELDGLTPGDYRLVGEGQSHAGGGPGRDDCNWSEYGERRRAAGRGHRREQRGEPDRLLAAGGDVRQTGRKWWVRRAGGLQRRWRGQPDGFLAAGHQLWASGRQLEVLAFRAGRRTTP